MAGKKPVSRSPARATEPLYREIRTVLESARTGAYRAVNAAMVEAYWQVGHLIVEHEQRGQRRAAYGEAVLEELSRRLTAEFGRGFDIRNLRYMRQFYLVFPALGPQPGEAATGGKRNALRSESGAVGKRNALRSESSIPTLRSELSWTHYRLILGVDDARARDWYMNEAATEHWSTRQLERQISVLYYERLLASRKKAPVHKEARRKLATVAPEQFIRDPYVLEFLDLKDYPALRESAVEQAIIDNLQAFLLELGKGFSFVARQKRMRFEDEDFYPEGDNPTIGLILCSTKNAAVAKYSVLSEGKRIFAAKYLKILPTEAELTREIERERRLIDARRAASGKANV